MLGYKVIANKHGYAQLIPERHEKVKQIIAEIWRERGESAAKLTLSADSKKI